MDEVPIGLRTALKSDYPTDEAILNELLDRIDK
jgi:hypothetical protein